MGGDGSIRTGNEFESAFGVLGSTNWGICGERGEGWGVV